MALDAIRHRGPDQRSTWTSGRVGLGFGRLALVGGPEARQPFAADGGRVVAVCNGEIYNHHALRRELAARGILLGTGSDCEVVPHLYSVYGPGFVSRLEGQFALVVWDAACRRLLLARDRFGICPLHWTVAGNVLAAASEVKGLVAAGVVEPALDVLGLAETALLYAPVPPRTCFEDVLQVPPASCVLFDAEAWRASTRAYWRPPLLDGRERAAPPVRPREVHRHADALDGALSDAVAARQQGEAAYGAYLSGGVDSATVCALACRGPRPPSALFSLSFREREVDESFHQRTVAEHLGAPRNVVSCSMPDVAGALRAVLEHVETPLFRLAPVPMYLLSRCVGASGAKFAMTGEGADELLCGYPIFRAGTWSSGHPDYAPMFRAHVARWEQTRRVLDLFHPQLEPRRLFRAALAELEQSLQLGYEPTPLARAQQVEVATKLSGYLLAAQGDRVAMAHSVELRFPFLDGRCADLALQMPEDVRLGARESKLVLRTMMAGRLPDSTVHRPKQGYAAPDARLLSPGQVPAFDRLIDAALSPAALHGAPWFDPARIGALLARRGAGEAGRADEAGLVFALTTLLLVDALGGQEVALRCGAAT